MRISDWSSDVCSSDLGATGELELRFRRSDGTEVPATVTIRTSDDTIVLALRPSGERRGNALISTVSHELRRPLTSVEGYTSLQLSRWDPSRHEQQLTKLEQVPHDDR